LAFGFAAGTASAASVAVGSALAASTAYKFYYHVISY
jgi:hypothetical protein